MQGSLLVKTTPSVPRQSRQFKAALCGLLLAGAANCLSTEPAAPDAARPANIYRAVPIMPVSVQRVALLPLPAAGTTAEAEFGREALERALIEELGRTRQFEVVAVSTEQLRRWTGRNTWTDEEALPHDLLDKLRGALGVDAVLFARLTHYHPYPPLTVGWRFKLATCQQPQILWAADEVCRAPDPAPASAPRRKWWHILTAHDPVETPPVVRSPTEHGRLAARRLFHTLPPRPAPAPPGD
jgi:hypothetical protein